MSASVMAILLMRESKRASDATTEAVTCRPAQISASVGLLLVLALGLGYRFLRRRRDNVGNLFRLLQHGDVASGKPDSDATGSLCAVFFHRRLQGVVLCRNDVPRRLGLPRSVGPPLLDPP